MLYLVKLEHETEKWVELELVMTGKGIADPVPLAHTSHIRAARLDKPMQMLYSAVEDAAVLPTLTPEAKGIIREYLGDS